MKHIRLTQRPPVRWVLKNTVTGVGVKRKDSTKGVSLPRKGLGGSEGGPLKVYVGWIPPSRRGVDD